MWNLSEEVQTACAACGSFAYLHSKDGTGINWGIYWCGNVCLSYKLMISIMVSHGECKYSCLFEKNAFELDHPGLFFFFLFIHKFYKKTVRISSGSFCSYCRHQWDSNSDHQSRRGACWPLNHHHGPLKRMLPQQNFAPSWESR